MEASRAGDRSAFDQLVRRYSSTALVVALAYTSDPDVAEDIAQDAIIQVWRALDRCDEPERFGSWLRTIVRRAALNRRARLERRRRIRARFGLDVVRGSMSSRAGELDHPVTEALDPRLARAVRNLAERQREILLLHDLEGRTHAEIADLLDIAPATSRKHLSDARSRVRAHLTGTSPSRGSSPSREHRGEPHDTTR